MAVVLAPTQKSHAVGMVQVCRIEPAALALQGCAVALQVSEMSIGGLTLAAAQFHDPRLHNDAARPEAHAALWPAPAAPAWEGGGKLGTSAARVEAACSLSSASSALGETDAAWVAAGPGDLPCHPLQERDRLASAATGARTTEPRLEARVVVSGHGFGDSPQAPPTQDAPRLEA